jgi:hypothetical protein
MFWMGCVTWTERAQGDEPSRPDLVFVTDPKFGMEGGIRTTLSMGQIVFRYDELLPDVLHVKNPTAERALGVFGRFVEAFFLDDAIASVETTFIHEVFGHGARAREFGQSPTYVFSLPQPYAFLLSPHEAFEGVTEVTSLTGNRDRDIAIVEAGVEANFLTAHWINEQIVSNHGWARDSDLDVYLASKTAYVTTFLSRDIHVSTTEVTDPTGGSDDIVRYVSELQDRTNRWRPSDRVAIVGKLQTAYAWNYVDPTFFFAIYNELVNRLYLGEHYGRIPLPSVGGVTFYPETRFNLSPFGAEHYVDVFLGKGTVVADVYARLGSSGLAAYDGGGVRVLGLRPCPWLAFGAELDAWSQPELLLAQRNTYSPPQALGLNGGLFGTFKLYGALSLAGKIAYKTGGYLMGQPLDAGPYGYVGVSVAQ